MTLTKVIEIIELNLKEAGKKMPPDTAIALHVAVQATKRIGECRRLHLIDPNDLLSGETKD